MVAPIVWGGIVLGGLIFGREIVKETGQALDASSDLVKWGAVAGGVYVSYRALQAGGVIK